MLEAAGYLWAKQGATKFQIMAVHGHRVPESGKVYTKGARRTRLAADGTQLFANLEW
jgi:hypothetical protein